MVILNQGKQLVFVAKALEEVVIVALETEELPLWNMSEHKQFDSGFEEFQKLFAAEDDRGRRVAWPHLLCVFFFK